MNDLEKIDALEILKNCTICFIREISHLCMDWITNSNFQLYLIWYFRRKDIKFKNSMKNKIAKKRAAALGNVRNVKQKHKFVSKCIFPLSARD